MSIRSEVIRILNEVLSGSKKISELPAAGTITGTELVEIVQDGVNKQTTTSEFGNSSTGISLVKWTFASHAGSFPTAIDTLYIAQDDHGSLGDADYVQANTWFIATSATPSVYADFSFK